MNMINRNNYEEFFLLYVDNELSAEQRQQVEAFVQEYPDLAAELELLQQTVISIDDEITFDKDLLYKNGNALNAENLEHLLVLYTDDELSNEEKRGVEIFAASNPAAQKELNLFAKTKLPAEKIIYPYKDELYKKEESTPVIAIRWWKIAVAAILILGAGFGIFSIVNKNNNAPVPGENLANTNKEQPANPSAKKNNADETIKEENKTAIESNLADATDKKQQQDVAPQSSQKINDDKEQLANQNNIIQNPSNNLPKEPVQNQQQKNDNSNLASNEKKPRVMNAIYVPLSNAEKTSPELATNILPKQNINKLPVTNAVSQTPDNTEDNNAVIYASNNSNKKFRGLLRKVSRVFEHTTNINPANEDDKVLIGGLALNLK